MKRTDVKTASTKHDTAFCFKAMLLLQPVLQAETFVSPIKMMQKEGHRFLSVSIEHKVITAAGYRVFTMLCTGKLLYIDLLGLECHRGKESASALLHCISCPLAKLPCFLSRQWINKNGRTPVRFSKRIFD